MNRRKRNHYQIKKNNKRNLNVLYIFRSVKHIYAQIIDTNGKVLLAVNSKHIKTTNEIKTYNILGAAEVGKLIGLKAKELGILEVVFNRGEYKYHGRVKALAEAARENIKI